MNNFIVKLEENLQEELIYNHLIQMIFNKDGRRLFSINKEGHLKFEGSWMKRRERWKYIISCYAATKDTTIIFSPSQFKDYLNYQPNSSDGFNLDTYKALLELNELFNQLDEYYDYGLIIDFPGDCYSLHILHPDSTFQLRWSVNKDEWELNLGTREKTNELTRKFRRGTLVCNIFGLIQEYNNFKIIQNIFGTPQKFQDKYPLLCDYFWKKLRISSEEYEKLARFVEDKLNISPLLLELELANSRKTNKIKTVMFSGYKIGGEDVFEYKKELTTDFSPNEIYFRKR